MYIRGFPCLDYPLDVPVLCYWKPNIHSDTALMSTPFLPYFIIFLCSLFIYLLYGYVCTSFILHTRREFSDSPRFVCPDFRVLDSEEQKVTDADMDYSQDQAEH